MGGEAGRHNQQTTGSHAAPTRGRRGLSITDNPEPATDRAISAAAFTLPTRNGHPIGRFQFYPLAKLMLEPGGLF